MTAEEHLRVALQRIYAIAASYPGVRGYVGAIESVCFSLQEYEPILVAGYAGNLAPRLDHLRALGIALTAAVNKMPDPLAEGTLKSSVLNQVLELKSTARTILRDLGEISRDSNIQ